MVTENNDITPLLPQNGPMLSEAIKNLEDMERPLSPVTSREINHREEDDLPSKGPSIYDVGRGQKYCQICWLLVPDLVYFEDLRGQLKTISWSKWRYLCIY